MIYTTQKILKILKSKSKSNKKNLEGMKRFGISFRKAFGVPIPFLRSLAKMIGKNHKLALKLWECGYHETKLLAAFVDEPEKVTEKQMDKWVGSFESWADCDTVCGSLLDKTPFAYKKALEYTKNKKEFIKRTGFTMFAWLAVHDKKADDKVFIAFLSIIERESTDERNFVKKAVNWALRQIGKRNENLRKYAIKKAKEILKQNSKSAQWIAKNALRELAGSNSNKIDGRFKKCDFSY